LVTTFLRKETTGTREPGEARVSLRSELLFQLACLAGVAVLLALWTVFLLQLPFFEQASPFWLVVLIALDLVLFVLLGNFLIQRFVMRPLTETAAAAAAIAGGDYERRVAGAQTREMDEVARSINRLTDQLLQNQERLAENVRSLERTNRALFEAQQELVQAEKLAAIGRLAAGVAHEVGNPLGALLGYAALLRRRGADAELLGGVEREAGRIDRIVRGLLDYARPSAEAREPLDVNETIERVLALLRKQGRLAGIEVELRLADGLPAVRGVRHSLEQLWLNLFTNAEAAMEGSGTLRIATLHAHFESDAPVPTRRADDPPGIDYTHLRRMRELQGPHANRLEPGTEIVQVVVGDDGPGIPAEHAAKIFDPFFTTKAPGEGTGLGLAIAATTVAELGGRIELAPPVGAGATFIVSLPVRGEENP
jgi:two-component system, NtrC family, sensor kinase